MADELDPKPKISRRTAIRRGTVIGAGVWAVPTISSMRLPAHAQVGSPMPEPTPENEARIKAFSTAMKLEPFQRGMKELAPTVWITALRKVQNPNRAGLDIVSPDANFNSLKVSPVFYWSDAEMEAYLKQHNLPNEWDYFDPAKADEKRECGLHASWGKQAVAGGAGI